MKCSKTRFAARPLVENLESRLQPGSVLTGPGYGWSLLADSLSILNQDSGDFQRRVAVLAFPSRTPTPSNVSGIPNRSSLDLAAATVAATRTDASSRAASPLFENLANGFLQDRGPVVSLTGHGGSVPLAAVAAPTAQLPAPATPVGSVPQSPLGIAAPASPLVLNTPGVMGEMPVRAAATALQARPIQAVNVDHPALQRIDVQPTANALQFTPLGLGNPVSHGGGASNQAALASLSYLGSSGPDKLTSIAVHSEGATNAVYVSGSLTDNHGRTDAFIAKLTNGATSVVWAGLLSAPTSDGTRVGPDSATGLAVSGNSVYVAGSLSDTAAPLQSDGFVAELNATSGALKTDQILNNASTAAITTDAVGNVDVGGSLGDPTMSSRRDVAFLQLTSDLSHVNFATFGPLMIAGQAANSTISTGGGVSLAGNGPSGRETGAGLIVDGQGNLYFAGTISAMGSNDNRALFGRLNASGGGLDWAFYFDNTDPNGNPTPGPGGRGSAVAFDPSGNVVFTGSINDNGSTPLNQDLLLGRATQAPSTTGGANVLDANHMWVDNRISPAFTRVGDWTGNDVTVLPDGSSLVTGAAYDPAAGTGTDPTARPTKGIDVHVTHFLSNDQTTVQNADHAPENIFGGSGTDIGNALTFDPNNPTNVYVVGSTTSKDLPTTSGVVQPIYGGSSTTGFVAQLTVS
ncbi:MAG TPA: hypothetical protein VKU02_14695 [Gemmataceae bacterium]|nr:hypothetical protein [Gemmataceae bacterium]